MNKSIRNLALTAAILLSSSPMFANMMGTNPHPSVVVRVSLLDYATILLTVAGL